MNKEITINPNNEPYYSKDFIKGFKCGAQRQFEADKSDADKPPGYWINDNGTFRCSVCGEREDAFIDGWDWEVCGASKFCPSCGAKLKGENDECRTI